MAISVTHTFVSPVADDSDPNEVGPDEWNATHTISGTLPVANGGTASATAADARTALGVAIGTDVQAYDAQLADIAGLAVTDGNIIVGDGANWVAESGATARTSLGLGTGNSPQFTAIELGHATENTLTASLGVLSIEGVALLTATAADALFLTPAEGNAAYQPLDADLTSWAGVTRAAGFDTFTATPSSANLASLVTDETGSGALVFGTSPGFTTAANPVSDDGAALGTTALGWSDAFYASGGTIHFANTDWVATHTAGILTVGTGDLRVTTAGANSASVVTVGGAQTLTSKTLTSPVIGTSPTAAGSTWTDLGAVTTADINGGTIDGVTIGGASAGAVTGTTITANTGFMPDANDGAYLGQSGTGFSDLFMADGAVVNFNAGEVTLTQTDGSIVLGGSAADLVLDLSNAAAGQIAFPATQNASAGANTLDDYEEGTWTPTFTATGATYSYTAQLGSYTKIGNRVFHSAQINLNTSGNTLGTADVFMSLPITVGTGTNAIAHVTYTNCTSSFCQLIANYVSSTATVNFNGNTAAGTSIYSGDPRNSNEVLHATNGTIIIVTGCYQV
jgi:hypothetical protein